jgi:hypothetical protein
VLIGVFAVRLGPHLTVGGDPVRPAPASAIRITTTYPGDVPMPR